MVYKNKNKQLKSVIDPPLYNRMRLNIAFTIGFRIKKVSE